MQRSNPLWRTMMSGDGMRGAALALDVRSGLDASSTVNEES